MTKDNDFFKMKNDQGKTDWSLLPWRAIESAARIMTIAIAPKEQGGMGYGLASWQDVPEGYFRYWAAMIRHIVRRFVYDEVIDQESGEPHMAHVICDAAFIFEKDRQWKEDGNMDINFYARKHNIEKAIEEQLIHKEKNHMPDSWKKQPTQIQLPHDIDYTEMFKQCDDTYEDNIRQMELALDYAKPNTKQLFCIKCGVADKDYLKKALPIEQKQCFHQWDIK